MSKVIPGVNDLATTHPNLVSEWHPTQNGNLTPRDVKAGSSKKVWWQCKEGHEWQATIGNRTLHRSGCPYCSGRRSIAGINDLATTNPPLAAEWHPTKNGSLTPRAISYCSGKKVWWQCAKGHEWEAVIASRSAGSSCPICSGKIVLAGFNDLATTRPSLAAEWHPTKNQKLSPDKVTSGRATKVWWQCAKGHEWQAAIYSRSAGSGCPLCAAELSTSFPEQAVFYYLNQLSPAINRYQFNNKTEIDVYLPEFHFGVEYDGRYHDTRAAQERDAKKNSVLATAGIILIRVIEVKDLTGYIDSETTIYCKPSSNYRYMNEVTKKLVSRLNSIAHQNFHIDIDIEDSRSEIYNQYITTEKANSLASLSPDLAAEWHPTNNGNLTPDKVTIRSDKKVWWQCAEDHEWQATIGNRTAGNGCPYCSGRRAIPGETDLTTIYPSLAAEWHPAKNGNLKPSNVTIKTAKKVWWQCEKGHEWQAVIYSRTSGHNCPYCTGQRVLPGINDLATTHPKLAAEWHPTKNGSLAPQNVVGGGKKKIWWKCTEGHEWQATIGNRKFGTSCPICYNKRRKQQ